MSDQAEGVTMAEELRRTQRKCFQLRKELQNLHVAFDKSEMAALRAEAKGYRKALSDIAYRMAEGEEIPIRTLRSIVYGALGSKNLKPSKRRLVERFRG